MKKKQEEIPFSQVLAELIETDQVFPAVQIHRFSSLSTEDSAALELDWEKIPLKRRRSLVADMAAFAEVDPLVFFERVGQIAIKDNDQDVRISAIRLLVIEEDPGFAATLVDLLNSDPHYLVRAAAASALGTYVYLGEIEEIPSDVYEIVNKALLAAYRADEQVLVRRRALESVSYSSRKEINALIEDAFTSGDEDWQESALIAMGVSANLKWESKVLEMFDSESSQLRFEAVTAAGKLGIKEAKKALMTIAIEDEDPDVRQAAIWSLSELGGSDVAELIEDWLDEASTEEEAEFLEDALENLLESQMFDDLEMPLFDFDEDGLNDLSEIDMDDEGDD